MVVALIALLFAMTGTGLAAKSYVVTRSSQIKDGAVTGADVKNGSLTGSDVKDRSLVAADFKGSVRGREGRVGPQGLTGPRGEPGPQGEPGADASPNSVLKPGQTLTGVYSAEDNRYSGVGFVTAAVNFSPKLPRALPWDAASSGVSTDCPGRGEAAPGHLCVYPGFENGLKWAQVMDPETASDLTHAIREYGTVLTWVMVAPVPSDATLNTRGTWAMTAPGGQPGSS